MTISWSKTASGLRWIAGRNKPVTRRKALVLTVIASLLGLTSHAVVAQPWSDHGSLARTIARAAACAGAQKLLQGATPLQIKRTAINRLVQSGFRQVHGYEASIIPRIISHGPSGAKFSVAVSIVHQDKHYLLENFIDYRPSWATQSVVVREANFDQCNRDLLAEA